MEKLESLRDTLRGYERLCVAYSGGTDSSFLAWVAHEALGDGVLAVLVDSPTLARRDRREAVTWLEKAGIRYETVEEDPLASEAFRRNDTLRCYFCKRGNYSLIRKVADRHGIGWVADGQNADDARSAHRPGLRAGREMGVVSPLSDCGLTKDDVRRYGKLLGVTTWDKPANACLSSRIPYGVEITRERLLQIESAEELLRSRGMEGCRVRCHGDVARIEAPQTFFSRLLNETDLTGEMRAIGFKYITLDMDGFRSGSMNE
jgi:uncharacterized protein